MPCTITARRTPLPPAVLCFGRGAQAGGGVSAVPPIAANSAAAPSFGFVSVMATLGAAFLPARNDREICDSCQPAGRLALLPDQGEPTRLLGRLALLVPTLCATCLTVDQNGQLGTYTR